MTIQLPRCKIYLAVDDAAAIFMEVETCPVHGTKLENRKLPVRFGLPERDEEFDAARRVLSPYSHEWIGGGCEPSDDVHDHSPVCDECLRDAATWRDLIK